jgi:hypothetical protein
MRLAAPFLLLGCAAAQAQPAGAFGPTAQLLERRLGQLASGLLVVVDDPKGAWKGRVDALAASPEWVDLEIPVAYYGGKAGEVSALLQLRHQTGPRPQWAVFGEGGRLVACGGTPPEAEALLQAARAGGLRSRPQILRDFLRTHPDHLGALEDLLYLLRDRAIRRTELRFGARPEPLRAADERLDMARWQKDQEARAEAQEREETQREAQPPEPLAPEEDQAIWGELADLLDRTFRNGDWDEIRNGALIPGDAAAHSLLMQAACRAAVPDVERALARQPTSWSLWEIWLGLTATFGGKPIRPLLDGLLPSPTLPPAAWPPEAVREAYVKDARRRRDWQGIRDLLLPQVERAQLQEAAWGIGSVRLEINGRVQEDTETGDTWRGTLEPLVEALLHLGETGTADGLVRDAWARHPWPGLPGRASALAARCGQPNFAAQWGALGGGR